VAGGSSHQVIDQTSWLVHFGAGSLTANPLGGNSIEVPDTILIRFNHVAPHFYASDIARARAFYEAVLGFSLHYSDGEPPHYVVMCRDDVYIHLSHPGPHGAPQHPGASFIAVAGVESLWAQVETARDCVVAALTDTDYGGGVRFKVFVVRDPDGNLLRIGESQSVVAT
jgi:catechol 2,3-dioxygenase-like lactoylglutathione lyase family enzyme